MATNFDARLANYSPTLLSIFRIVFGLAYTIHGSQKLFGWPVAAPGLISVGDWPMWWAALIEFVAGLLITVGLFTRIAAFIASGEMAVAYLWMHWPPLEGPKGSFWPLANNGEPALLFCFGFLAIAGLGAGTLSVDSRRRGVGRTVTGTAAPAGYSTGRPVRRPGLLSRFRRPRY